MILSNNCEHNLFTSCSHILHVGFDLSVFLLKANLTEFCYQRNDSIVINQDFPLHEVPYHEYTCTATKNLIQYVIFVIFHKRTRRSRRKKVPRSRWDTPLDFCQIPDLHLHRKKAQACGTWWGGVSSRSPHQMAVWSGVAAASSAYPPPNAAGCHTTYSPSGVTERRTEAERRTEEKENEINEGKKVIILDVISKGEQNGTYVSVKNHDDMASLRRKD